MRKFIFGLIFALWASVAFAQSNVRPIYDDTPRTGVTTQQVDSGSHGLPIQLPAITQVSVNPTVTASSAYAAQNVVGGNLTFAGAVPRAGGGGVVRSVVLTDTGGNNVGYNLFLFTAAASAQTDKTAVALVAGDLANCIGVIALSTPALGAASTMGVETTVSAGLAFSIGGTGTSLYGVLVTTGTPTFASASGVRVKLSVDPD